MTFLDGYLLSKFISSTLKRLKTIGYVLSIGATDALVLKHQAINTDSADLIFIALD